LKEKRFSKNKISQFKIPAPPVIKLADKPQTTAQNYILIDVDTNKILASKNAQDKIYPASTTKLITALTAYWDIYGSDQSISKNKISHFWRWFW
jgi:D-alanyl-D-alanine carboxypeptidase